MPDISSKIINLDLRTRFIISDLQLLFLPLDGDASLLHICENDFLNSSKSALDPTTKFINLAKSKNKTKEIDEFILEIFSGLSHKITNLQNKIDSLTALISTLKDGNISPNSAISSLESSFSSTTISHLGHGYLVASTPIFIANSSYYSKLFLPIFPERYIPLFTTALNAFVTRIDRINLEDLEDYDNYIANRELETIRSKKTLKGE